MPAPQPPGCAPSATRRFWRRRRSCFPGDEGALAIDTFTLRRVRPILQGTLGRYFFEGGAAGGADRESENVAFIRTQLSF